MNHAPRDYIKAALRHAKYEISANKAPFYSEIPHGLRINANANTRGACRKQGAEMLEKWILFRVHRHFSLPEINGMKPAVGGVSWRRFPGGSSGQIRSRSQPC
jgi:hypothetical protein